MSDVGNDAIALAPVREVRRVGESERYPALDHT